MLIKYSDFTLIKGDVVMFIILTENSSVINLAKENGEKIFAIKEVKLKNIVESQNIRKEVITSDNLDYSIAKLLIQLGIPANIKGFTFIKYALKELLTNPNFGKEGITKGIYSKIANSFETTSSRVERAIRHSVELACKRGDLDLFEEIFSSSVDADKWKPTNSEFIYDVKIYLDNKLRK